MRGRRRFPFLDGLHLLMWRHLRLRRLRRLLSRSRRRDLHCMNRNVAQALPVCLDKQPYVLVYVPIHFESVLDLAESLVKLHLLTRVQMGLVRHREEEWRAVVGTSGEMRLEVGIRPVQIHHLLNGTKCVRLHAHFRERHFF
jgi:hypothetical protein